MNIPSFGEVKVDDVFIGAGKRFIVTRSTDDRVVMKREDDQRYMLAGGPNAIFWQSLKRLPV